MEKILLSSLVGVITYFVLSAGTQFTETKFEGFELKGGIELNVRCDDEFPECFEISENARNIFKYLKGKGKCGTDDYNNLAKLYSKMFCFEIALGNNRHKHVAEEKVKQILEELNGKYGRLTVLHENMNSTFIKDPLLIHHFVEDINLRILPLLKNLEVDDNIYDLHSELKTIHEKQMYDLYKRLIID